MKPKLKKMIKKEAAMEKVKKFLLKEGYSEKDIERILNTKQQTFFNFNTYDFYDLVGDEKIIIQYFKECLHGEIMGS